MAVQERLYTAKDLDNLPDDGHRYELDRGELVIMPPAKKEHGLVVLKASRLLGNHVEVNDLGEVMAEIGYKLESDPDTVRAPDISFISKARMAPLTGEYEEIAPDLAVEVASPGNTVSDMNQKILQYFEAGVRLVWVIFPKTRMVHVYYAADKITVLKGDAMLEGGDVLPGFSVRLSELFTVLDR
jgi:Uma2 family endonuclease